MRNLLSACLLFSVAVGAGAGLGRGADELAGSVRRGAAAMACTSIDDEVERLAAWIARRSSSLAEALPDRLRPLIAAAQVVSGVLARY